MADDKAKGSSTMTEPLQALIEMQQDAMKELFGQYLGKPEKGEATAPAEITEWTSAASELQAMWLEFIAGKTREMAGPGNPFDPSHWMLMMQHWTDHNPVFGGQAQTRLMNDSVKMWEGVLDQMLDQTDPKKAQSEPDLPRQDRRFSDPVWKLHPAYALIHQSYLLVSEYLLSKAEELDMEGLDPEKKKQIEFATRGLVEAMSPDNFIMTNPVVMQKTIETRGQNLVTGMRHLIGDLKRGQLTHTDSKAFKLGENIAATPGKVVHETPLYQLIQYSPTTEQVMEVPLVIFPPWINRFYILDLSAKKSFVRWAVAQGITVFMVSWKSADASMADLEWDDYIRSQIEVIDHVRERLRVPAVHTIGYCVAGTTLAATLAVLERRGEANKVKSATFFTAQVDFEKGGELKNFIDDGQLELISKLSPEGYLDGRYLAVTFNALRGRDLIWSYVVNNYLMGQEYPAFDLLHWNGDVTNLPAKWHNNYLRDLYRDNKLVIPDELSADGTPIDLTRVKVPSFIQAGREDHIAPAESVWRITRHFRGPLEFVLAGSGHIAGVVNPPEAGKYQYWTGDSEAGSLDDFVAGSTEHPGSWWPYWLDWLKEQGFQTVPAKGKRKPGGKNDPVIEDAPGRYVKAR